MNFKHLHYFWVTAKAGGIMREPMSCICAGESATKAQMVSWVITWKAQEMNASARTHAPKSSNSPWVERFRQVSKDSF